MKHSDFEEFKKTMFGLGVIYDRKTPDSILDVYWTALTNVSIEEFKHATGAHTLDPDQGMFFPKPAHLMRHIQGTAKQQEQSISDKAELAWSEVMQKLTNDGTYGNLKMSDGRALAAIKTMGGWSALGVMTNDEITWRKKDFMSAYETYERTPVDRLPTHVAGLIEETNKKILPPLLNGALDGLNKLEDK